jgi:hypothetical protein
MLRRIGERVKGSAARTDTGADRARLAKSANKVPAPPCRERAELAYTWRVPRIWGWESPNSTSTHVPLTGPAGSLILREVTARAVVRQGESQAKRRASGCVPISDRPSASSCLTLT